MSPDEDLGELNDVPFEKPDLSDCEACGEYVDIYELHPAYDCDPAVGYHSTDRKSVV